jgi:hypothetical protein
MLKTIKESLNNENVNFNEFYNALQEKAIGDWDNINDEDIIKQYVSEMMEQDIPVGHILNAIENNPSSQELYVIWLGNSMETPKPIDTKEDLVNGLGLDEDDLNQEIDID